VKKPVVRDDNYNGSMLTTDQKGAVAEAALIQAAIELGLGVSWPVVETRYDLVFDTGMHLLRVQCKWAACDGEVIAVRCYSARRDATGFVRRAYGRGEVDVFGVYCPDPRSCFLVPFDDVPPGGSLQLRVSPPRNGQKRNVRWAKDFDMAATLTRRGAIAQLGERLAGSQEVTGSNPVGSITDRARCGGAADFGEPCTM
jgi:PD-(D/E)XK nuclease superfamily protein